VEARPFKQRMRSSVSGKKAFNPPTDVLKAIRLGAPRSGLSRQRFRPLAQGRRLSALQRIGQECAELLPRCSGDDACFVPTRRRCIAWLPTADGSLTWGRGSSVSRPLSSAKVCMSGSVVSRQSRRCQNELYARRGERGESIFLGEYKDAAQRVGAGAGMWFVPWRL
jgi:hypothetical protein